jgi:hypothetical protein
MEPKTIKNIPRYFSGVKISEIKKDESKRTRIECEEKRALTLETSSTERDFIKKNIARK